MTRREAEAILDAELLKHGLPRKVWYRTIYLHSEHWKTLRLHALDHHGRKCHNCQSTRFLDVHHLRYSSIYDVTVDDLQILCRPCHDKTHEKAVPCTQKPKKQPKTARKKAKKKQKRTKRGPSPAFNRTPKDPSRQWARDLDAALFHGKKSRLELLSQAIAEHGHKMRPGELKSHKREVKRLTRLSRSPPVKKQSLLYYW